METASRLKSLVRLTAVMVVVLALGACGTSRAGSLASKPSAPTAITLVSGLDLPTGVARDSSGNLWISNDGGGVSVLATKSTTLFGKVVPADKLTTFMSGQIGPSALAFDSSGNLWIANEETNAVSVLAPKSTTLFGTVVPADKLTTMVSGLDHPSALAFDASGDLYIAIPGPGPGDGAVSVLAPKSTTLFGTVVPADKLTTLVSGLVGPTALAFDSTGDLFIANTDSLSTNAKDNTVLVLAPRATTVFGKVVPADKLTTLLAGRIRPSGIAFDSSGDLYVTNQSSQPLSVLAPKSTTLFGKVVPADKLTTLISSSPSASGLAFGPSGDLYIINPVVNAVSVLAPKSTTLFGTAVPADKLTTLVSGLDYPTDVAVDAAGNLYITSFFGDTVSVLAPKSTTLFGTAVPADKLTTLVSGLVGPTALAFDSTGDLFVANTGVVGGDNTISVLAPRARTLFGKAVPADKLTTLVSGLSSPTSLAVDDSGDLYIANEVGSDVPSDDDTVLVLAPRATTLFGKAVLPDKLTTLVSGLASPMSLAFDTSGNLYIGEANVPSDNGTLSVLAPRATALFDKAVRPDKLTTLVSGLASPSGLVVDTSGDLYIANPQESTVMILAPKAVAVFDKAVLPDKLTTLVSGLADPGGLALDSSGDLYIANQETDTVSELRTGKEPSSASSSKERG